MGQMRYIIVLLLIVIFILSCEDGSTTPDNAAPDEPCNPHPADNSIDIFRNAWLEWSCSDEDDDALTYDIYFGATASPELIFSNLSNRTFDQGLMEANSEYFWQIAVFDGEMEVFSPVWKFTTGSQVENHPPLPPHHPMPSDEAVDISIATGLCWQAADSEGDTLSFDVYLSLDPDPGSENPIAENLLHPDFYPELLEYETTYYWQVIADDGEFRVASEVWSFETRIAGTLWRYIPAGVYTCGEDDEFIAFSNDFEMMKYEVTNFEYMEYLEAALLDSEITLSSASITGFYAGDCHYPLGFYEYYELDDGENKIYYDGESFRIELGYAEHPVVEVTWFGAYAYAQYYGWKLPTDEEWEIAARSMTGFEYPWGDELKPCRANYLDSEDPFDNGTTPVGFYNGQKFYGIQTYDSPSIFGCYDMCGNVFEWTDSWYSENCTSRGIRGGSWEYNIFSLYLKSWKRDGSNSPFSSSAIGFRCAKTVD